MRALGLLLLLFGIATLVVHFMELDVEVLDWLDNWGENVAWAIRIGSVALGLILMAAGGRKAGKKK